jgi:hypothetical protein
VSGNREGSIPLELEVWNFDLPSISSLITRFGFSGMKAVREHFGKYTGDQAVADITSVYQKAALWHRITLDGSSGTPPPLSTINGRVGIQWDKYDAHMAPLMDGTVLSRGQPLYGAKATSVTLHPPPSLKNRVHQIQYWQNVAAHFRRKGWFDRLVVYLWDEPQPTQFDAMIDLGRTIRRADPHLRMLVTAPLHPGWSDFVDIWTPTVNCLEHRPGHPDFCTPTIERAGYETELARGKQLWWYQACGTHGCNIVGGKYFTGWPTYVIDGDAIRHRIMEWLTWRYGIGGELYFSTNEAFAQTNVWNDVRLHGGNGDGTLFYPGRPDIVGGVTHIPIESIRLKLIREGLEDYEYLVLLRSLGRSDEATKAVNSLVRRAYDFETNPETIYAVREKLAKEILGR